MANPSKNKGDRCERELVPVMKQLLPEYAHDDAQRFLGAGRARDVGDIWLLPDVAIQAKYWSNVSAGLLAGARGAAQQAVNARTPFGVNVSRLHNVRLPAVRWVVSTFSWVGHIDVVNVPQFKRASDGLAYVCDESVSPRNARHCVVVPKGNLDDAYVLAPLETWTHDYRAMRVREV